MSKEIMVRPDPKKGLSIHKKSLHIGFNISEKDQVTYYTDRIKELEKANQNLKNALNSLSEKRDYIKALEGFRKLLTLDCIVLHRKLTIFQCSDCIRKSECTFYEQCKPRKDLMKKLLV